MTLSVENRELRRQSLIVGFPVENVIADKGYDSNDFRQAIIDGGAQHVIPPRSNRKISKID